MASYFHIFIGSITQYHKMTIFLGINEYKVAEIPLETCQEWHAVIDVHGKAYRKGFTDEQWLLE